MPDKIHPLEELLHQRIVVLDGAMGTMIQRRKLSEQDYRGERFRDWKGRDLKGSLELLNLTQPHVIEEIHAEYLVCRLLLEKKKRRFQHLSRYTCNLQ